MDGVVVAPLPGVGVVLMAGAFQDRVVIQCKGLAVMRMQVWVAVGVVLSPPDVQPVPVEAVRGW
jgi:hypothetical protein